MRTLKLIIPGWKSASLALCMILFFVTDAIGKGKMTKNAPVFTDFTYQGEDAVYKNHSLKADEFYNPILQGCYPDPSITRKGNDYYLVCSSFAMFPGVPIEDGKEAGRTAYHSLQWRNIDNKIINF